MDNQNNQNKNSKNRNEKHFYHKKRKHHHFNRKKKLHDEKVLETSPAEIQDENQDFSENEKTGVLENTEKVVSSESSSFEGSFLESPEEEKILVVGLRFRPSGKNYSFDPSGFTLMVGDSVIVETSQGLEFGVVSTANRYVNRNDIVTPLKKIIRVATEKDIQQHKSNKELELEARKTFLKKAKEHNLEMALSDVEYSFDRSKLVFYFTSEGRVDFRELVKDMATVFKTRIELRQIGVRDEAKQLGGLGICGRPLCCSTFLDDFQQVSIKMAKEQNLSLNPTKISGSCGRLMCCLRYENSVYVEASKNCPKVDAFVMTPNGQGTVIETNVLCGKCKVKMMDDSDSIITFSVDELKVLHKNKKASSDNAEAKKDPEENS